MAIWGLRHMAIWGRLIHEPFATYLTVPVGSLGFPALGYSLITYVILRPKRKSGSTIREIVIGVAIMVTVALTVASRPGIATASKMSCIAVLMQLEGAKAQWAVENKQLPTAVPADSDIFGPTLYLRAWPLCEQGGHYTLNAVSVPATCSKSEAPNFHTLSVHDLVEKSTAYYQRRHRQKVLAGTIAGAIAGGLLIWAARTRKK